MVSFIMLLRTKFYCILHRVLHFLLPCIWVSWNQFNPFEVYFYALSEQIQSGPQHQYRALLRTVLHVSCIMRSLHWPVGVQTIPSPVFTLGIVRPVLFSDSLLRPLESRPTCTDQYQPEIQRDSVVAFQSPLSVQLPLSGIPAALASSTSHLSLFSARLRLLGRFGVPLPGPQPRNLIPAQAGPEPDQQWPPCVSLPSGIPVLPCLVPSVIRQFRFLSFIRISSCLWRDSNLHGSYFFMGKVEVPGGF